MSQQPIKDGDGNVIGARLLIEGATYRNTGSYECKAQNSHGLDTGMASLNVEKDFGSK